MDIAKIRKKTKKDIKSQKSQKDNKREEETGKGKITDKISAIEETPIPDEAPEDTLKEWEGDKKKVEESEEHDKTAPEESQVEKILSFRLSQEEYGFYMKDIQEITNYYSLTPIPRSPDYLAGVISLRGKIVPLLNIKRLFHIPEKVDPVEKTKKNEKKVIILKAPRGPLGVIADLILGTRNINKALLRDSPGNITENEAKYIDSVAVLDNRFVSILNVKSIGSLNLLLNNGSPG